MMSPAVPQWRLKDALRCFAACSTARAGVKAVQVKQQRYERYKQHNSPIELLKKPRAETGGGNNTERKDEARS
jgi:hypothetical protein